jgi:hypothetical protein
MRRCNNSKFIYIFFYIFFQILVFSTKIYSQLKLKPTNTNIGAGIIVSSSNNTAFWQRTNRNGNIPLASNLGYFYFNTHRNYDSTFNINKKLKKFGYGYGFGVHANFGKNSQFLIPEGYLKFRYSGMELYIGRRKEIVGLTDSTLSSGSIIWSQNAMPIPKIQFSMPDYIGIFGSKLIYIKGSFAHGWFGNQFYVQDYFLHQKTLYGKIGKPNWKVHFFGGLNNQMQWAGYSDFIKNNAGSSKNGYLPFGFNSFFSAAFPLPYIRRKFPPNFTLLYDATGYGGNHIGSLDLATQIYSKIGRILLYRQIPYELGSLFTSLVNADDGIYGMSVKLKKSFYSINSITIEGIHTYNQGYYRAGIARLLNLPDRHFGELHRYFNHGQYNDGWSYFTNAIGTPLVLSNQQLNPENKLKDNQFLFSNYSQTKQIYFAVNGHIDNFTYLLKTNFGYHRATMGSYMVFNPSIFQFSGLSMVEYKHKNTNFKVSFALDQGQMLFKSRGLEFGIQKIL